MWMGNVLVMCWEITIPHDSLWVLLSQHKVSLECGAFLGRVHTGCVRLLVLCGNIFLFQSHSMLLSYASGYMSMALRHAPGFWYFRLRKPNMFNINKTPLHHLVSSQLLWNRTTLKKNFPWRIRKSCLAFNVNFRASTQYTTNSPKELNEMIQW